MEKVNAVASDTCNQMRAVWDILERDPLFYKVFFVPCVCHVLQLLVKDIFEIPAFSPVLATANKIVSFFNASKLQQARLKTIIRNSDQRVFKLVKSVITRWGTQFKLFTRLVDLKPGLKSYAQLPECTMEQGMKSAILDNNWWVVGLTVTQCFVSRKLLIGGSSSIR